LKKGLKDLSANDPTILALWEFRGLTPDVGAGPRVCPGVGRHRSQPLPREIPKNQKETPHALSPRCLPARHLRFRIPARTWRFRNGILRPAKGTRHQPRPCPTRPFGRLVSLDD